MCITIFWKSRYSGILNYWFGKVKSILVSLKRKMSRVFWIISWTDSNLLLIELIFTCPKSKFLRCLDFVFFTNEKRRFSNFIWLLPLPFKVSWDKLFEDFEFYSVSGLSLSKASWERDDFPPKKCLGKFYVKLAYVEQE